MKQTVYAFAALAALALPAQAQNTKQANDSTLNRTVVVEQEYTPDIVDAAKVNVLPRVEEPVVDKKAVEYDETLVPAAQVPAPALQAYTGKEEREKARPGHVRLGYGNYGNLDTRASYRFDLGGNDRIDLGFRMNGMDGDLEYGQEDWGAFFYHTNASVGYRHSFRRATLDIAGDFDQKNFNFVPGLSFSKQKLMSGGVHIGSASTDNSLPLQYRVETNLRFYGRQHDLLADSTGNTRETLVRTKADVWGAIDDGQAVGIAAEMNNVLYDWALLENYTALTLTPYYRLKPGRWDIRLGLNVDLSFGYGKSFRVSPDASAQLAFADSHLFYVRATGGKRLNGFQRMGELNPYVLLSGQLDATYELVDANVGYKASPANGLWFNIHAGYQNLQNELFFVTRGIPSGSRQLAPATADIQNLHAGLEISYDCRGLFGITASGVYRHWFDDTDGTYEKCKPSFVGHVRADIRPVSLLEVSVGFRYVSEVEETGGSSLDEYTDLYLRGSYEFTPGVAIYLQAANLAGTRNLQRYWGYPTEGANFVGGVSFRF